MFFYGWSFQSPSQAGAMKVPLWSTMWRHVIKALWRDYNWWELKHYNHIIVYLDYPYCDTLPDIIHIYTRVNLHLGFHDNTNFKPNISYLTTSIILLGIRYTSKMSLYVTQVNEILSIIIQFKVYYIYSTRSSQQFKSEHTAILFYHFSDPSSIWKSLSPHLLVGFGGLRKIKSLKKV